MQPPEVKGDGKIILSFKENQCVVETLYDPPVTPPPLPPSAHLSREPSPLPFYQTILAGNPQGSSWMTFLVVFQAIAMIVGMLILIGIGAYLIQRDQDKFALTTEAHQQLKNQEASILFLQNELKRLTDELKKSRATPVIAPVVIQPEIETRKAEPLETPIIETNAETFNSEIKPIQNPN